MQHADVGSTSIRSVDYDEARRRLEATFLSGARYRYDGVGRRVYDELVKAESVGACFNANVRDRYTFTRMDQAPKPKRPGRDAHKGQPSGHKAS